jgi:hypothetical protein
MRETIRQILSALASVDKGDAGTLWLSHALYPRECVSTSVKAFRDFCSFEIIDSPSEVTRLAIRVVAASPADRRRITGEFLNHLLATSVEQKLGGTRIPNAR